MQTFPLAYDTSRGMVFELVGDQAHMPQIPPPCFSLRSRREVAAPDQQNARMVEHWQTDSPALTSGPRVTGSSRYMDMNPTPSRLYREDMRQSQPFLVPSENSEEQALMKELDRQIAAALAKIQDSSSPDLATYQDLYKVLLQRKQQLGADSLSRNPYFDKYDVRGDPRNLVRELRAAVSEDVADRGLVESQKLFRRGMENRWLPAHFAESEGLDSLTAFELMRPRMNQQDKIYF